MYFYAKVGLLFLLVQVAVPKTDYQESLSFTACTPAHRWPDDEKEFLKWLDHQLISAPSDKYPSILATKGFYQHCNRNPEGRRNLTTALSLAPHDARILCFCIIAGKIKVDISFEKVSKDDEWEANYFVSKFLAEGDLSAAEDINIPKRNEPVVQLIRAL